MCLSDADMRHTHKYELTLGIHVYTGAKVLERFRNSGKLTRIFPTSEYNGLQQSPSLCLFLRAAMQRRFSPPGSLSAILTCLLCLNRSKASTFIRILPSSRSSSRTSLTSLAVSLRPTRVLDFQSSVYTDVSIYHSDMLQM